ncbi:Magnesium and cobalt efflux protein CorC [Microbacterium esteraromaticum]|uniref:Magnesium and cobalt efflux protein CorC n=1 Tax=Microbacterium esteraromaticum TaxID=57043 RepID=A0A1R4KIY0_9MICO|nr:hemolysin family protein [Microbacterium esteraromaticum]SJN44238.1 Magnesium and cobalt efflux protein CorC [Microbacterium esteraromaticum]
MTVAILLAAAVLLVAFGGLMAAVDAAFSVSSRTDLIGMASEGRNAAALQRIADDPDPHVNAVAFIRVLAETTSAVLVTVALDSLLPSIWWAMLAAALLMTGITFVLVGASPRSFGRLHATKMLRAWAPTVRAMRILLGPLAQALVRAGQRVTPGAGRSSFTSEDQLLSMVDEAASNALIEEDDRDLIHSVFDFTEQFVRAVMVPRTEMQTVDAAATTTEAMDLFLRTGVSRMPVVDDDADDVVGVLYLKDLVLFAFRDESAWRGAPVRPIARPAVFVPESMRAETLLQQMKRDAVHVCMVINEHGGISGLVTLEDLIEELVGEIEDEYDRGPADLVDLGDGRYRVNSRLSLEDVGELFGLELEDEDVDSIGGLLGKALGQVPQPGATATVKGLVLTGGASRGRGRGIATVFAQRAPEITQQERDGGDRDD